MWTPHDNMARALGNLQQVSSNPTPITCEQALDARINKLMGDVEALQLIKGRLGALKDMSASELHNAFYYSLNHSL